MHKMTQDIFHITAKNENKQDKNMKTKFHVKIKISCIT